MDMSSSSLPDSAACGASDSPNGLKFGEKAYFEDAGGGGGSSSKVSSGLASNSASPAQPKKGKGSAQGAAQPSRCQVEGCNMDLSDAKAYYYRHKVCGMHSKSPKVIVAGLEQRFCQQCSRFHQLPEFDQGKRSCRRRLAGHNERRRKPPPGSIPSRIEQLSSSFHDDNSRLRGFTMDFTYPRLTSSSRGIWPTVRAGDQVPGDQLHGSLNALTCGTPPHGFHPYMQGSAARAVFSGLEISPHRSLVGVSDSSCALSLLSNDQPWDSNTTARNEAPLMLGTSSFDGSHVAQQVINSSYTNSWEFKGHGADGSAQGMQHTVELRHAVPSKTSQFSGELELALQGSRQGIYLDPARAYGHTEDVSHGHWSL